MTTYLTRPDNAPATLNETTMHWRNVDALRTVQSILACGLVKARRLARSVNATEGIKASVTEHEAVLAFISAKLVEANIAYYEADETRADEYARRTANGQPVEPTPHMHSSGTPH